MRQNDLTSVLISHVNILRVREHDTEVDGEILI